MESPDLNPHAPEDARLETWLRTHGASAPLPDDGFTVRVLAALPPPASVWHAERRRAARRRAWFCLAGAALGCAVSISAGTAGLAQDADALLSSFAAAGAQLATPSLGLALLATAASLAVAYWPALARLGRRLQ